MNAVEVSVHIFHCIGSVCVGSVRFIYTRFTICFNYNLLQLNLYCLMVTQSVTSSHAYLKTIQSKTKIINAELNKRSSVTFDLLFVPKVFTFVICILQLYCIPPTSQLYQELFLIYVALTFQKQLLYMQNLLSPIVEKFNSVVTKVIIFTVYSCVLIFSYRHVFVNKKVKLFVALDD